MLAAAAAEAERLVVGVDASAAAMAEASRRAARPARARRAAERAVRGGRRRGAAPELDGLADRVTVHFPWGSLLRGLLAADPAILDGLVRVMRPGATLSMLVSSTARDRGAGVGPIDQRSLAALAVDYRRFGLEVTRVRPATPADVAASRSTWGRRLGAGAQRPAWLLEASLEQLGQAGAGLVEAGRGLVEAGPGVGGGQAVGDGAQGVPPRVEVVQLRPLEGDRDGRAG